MRALILILGLLLGQAPPSEVQMSAERLDPIEPVVRQAIADKKLTGCVILIGRKGRVVYRKAFGDRAVVPVREPMTADTIFDLASLTKVVATAPSVMLLVQEGRLRLSDPIALYIPEIKDPVARKITLQELLTHTSGYGSGLDRTRPWQGEEGAAQELARELARHTPGTHFEYSDINYIALGILVHRVTGQTLAEFARENLYRPLGMTHTGFGPRTEAQVAPTERRGGAILRGTVHDHVSARMGGVAGHAGLFSTADDLALFCQAWLDGRVLSPATQARTIRPVVVDREGHARGLGWDLDSPFSSNRGELFPRGSFGHTGFTGTSLWIDPTSQMYVVFLSNRVHPDGQGDVTPLRARIATLAAAAATDSETAWRAQDQAFEQEIQAALPAFLRKLDPKATPAPRVSRRTLNGIDILQENHFREVQGLRLGLVTNHTGRNKNGESTVDLLHQNADLKKLFSPEHGLRGVKDEKIADETDPRTGLKVISLYGDKKKPTAQDLEGLDALVFDIQDCGTRFYTYSTTLKLILEAAAENHLKVFVLDRPNPLGGELCEGPIADRESFTCPHSLPVTHAMTLGELARMYNTERGIGADLQVIKMDPWARSLWFDQTQQVWVNPSPNLRGPTAALLYPGVGLWEATNLSVGRGTDRPFEQFGAPWLDGPRLALILNETGLEGVRFVPVSFTPTSSKFANESCSGVQILVVDRQAVRPVRMGMEIASALLRLHPKEFQTEKLGQLLDNADALERLLRGETPAQIEASWQPGLDAFRERRARFLLY